MDIKLILEMIMNKDIEVTLLSKEEIRKSKLLEKDERECSIP